jgi:ABC-type branched-subunit amino acid transport system permease subunit
MSGAQILIENVLNALVAGVLIGCIYGLMCVGLGLIFGVMRVVNFAQGDFLMLGMYAAYYHGRDDLPEPGAACFKRAGGAGGHRALHPA